MYYGPCIGRVLLMQQLMHAMEKQNDPVSINKCNWNDKRLKK